MTVESIRQASEEAFLASGPGYLTVEQACEYLQVGRTWLYAQTRAGRLPSYRLGPHMLRLKVSDLDEFAAQRAGVGTPDEEARADRP